MPLEKTTEGKWVVYHRITGQRIVRWPVDARGMLASGEYTGEASECAQSPSADADVPATVVVRDVSASGVAVSSVDPVPHATLAAKQNAALSPTGAPLVVARGPDASSPAAPVKLPGAGSRTPAPRRGE